MTVIAQSWTIFACERCGFITMSGKGRCPRHVSPLRLVRVVPLTTCEGAVDAAVKLGQAMYNAGQQGRDGERVVRAYLREQGIDPDTYRWGQ